jgi:phosphoglycerate dehydrogenase-like enzyme
MIVIKILEPIGLEDQKWIEQLKNKKFGLRIEIDSEDTRGFDEEQLIRFVKNANILLLSNRPLNKKVIDACPNLQLVSVAFSGVDHVDTEACQKRNIPVKNAAGYSIHAVAELTLCLALNLYRRLLQAAESICEDHAAEFPLGMELFSKKIGLIGGGAIGLETAKLFNGLGCRISIFNRHPLDPSIHFAQQQPLEVLLATSDVISLHIPLNKETKHFISKERLALMKSSAILINTARGGIIDEQALIEALDQKRIAGAALDVFNDEPPLKKNHPLLNRENVLLTPHIGYRTREASLVKAELAFKNIDDWLSAQKIN